MKSSMKPQYKARAKIIKAMAHPSRLLIIEELNKKERCVGELRKRSARTPRRCPSI